MQLGVKGYYIYIPPKRKWQLFWEWQLRYSSATVNEIFQEGFTFTRKGAIKAGRRAYEDRMYLQDPKNTTVIPL